MSIPTNESNRRKRRRLYEEQAGRCHWCRQPMRWMEPSEARRYQRLPDESCTLDHLEPRWHPDRGALPGELRCVAACRRCNNERDRQLILSIPQEILRKAASGQRARDVAKEHAAELRLLNAAPRVPASEPLRVSLAEALQCRV